MEWKKHIFIKNIDELIDRFCAGNAKEFNKRIGQRDAATRWRHSGVKPSVDALIKMCNEFGCTVNWLLTGNEDAAGSGEGQEEIISCPTCCNWSPELKRDCETLKEILDSDDEDTKGAILSNLKAFRKSVQKDLDAAKKDLEIRELREDIKSLKKWLRKLHSDSQPQAGKSVKKTAR